MKPSLSHLEALCEKATKGLLETFPMHNPYGDQYCPHSIPELEPEEPCSCEFPEKHEQLKVILTSLPELIAEVKRLRGVLEEIYAIKTRMPPLHPAEDNTLIHHICIKALTEPEKP